MLAITGKGTLVHISFYDDIKENAGGYFCEVYHETDKELLYVLTHFCIPNCLLNGKADRLREAESFAKDYVADIRWI